MLPLAMPPLLPAMTPLHPVTPPLADITLPLTVSETPSMTPLPAGNEALSKFLTFRT
jgi:hypothetical protein